MAVKRIWYQSSGLTQGLTVTAKLYGTQNQVLNANISFTEMPDDAIYYSDVDFNTGRSMMKVYEDGQFVLMNVFDFGNYPGIISARIG